jgi:hypothetical protein
VKITSDQFHLLAPFSRALVFSKPSLLGEASQRRHPIKQSKGPALLVFDKKRQMLRCDEISGPLTHRCSVPLPPDVRKGLAFPHTRLNTKAFRLGHLPESHRLSAH